jgi:tetratricopeptide (TPR) repeat protein
MILAAILLCSALEPQLPTESSSPPPSPVASADIAPSGPAGEAIGAGLAAFKKRRFAKAEIEFRKAVEAEPQSAAANFYLGYTYYKMGERRGRMNEEKQKAKELFAKAFELDPQFRPVWGPKSKK